MRGLKKIDASKFLAEVDRKFMPKSAEIVSPTLVSFYWEGQHVSTRIAWLVQDLFPVKSVNLIVGESQAGKSFIAVDLAVAIASGRSFFGKKVKQGGVLYIAAEGAMTIPGRLKAARQGLPRDQKLMISIIHEPPPDLMDETAVDRIIATAQHINKMMIEATGLPLAAVIIDTMISGFMISNWNEVGETSTAMKILNRIQKQVDAAVIGVHHHGKDTSRGAAGSYALAAAADAILSVFKKGQEGSVTQRYISLTKSRFGETGRQLYFSLDTVPPDQREHEGDEQAFVVPISATTERPKPEKKGSQAEMGFKLAFDAALTDEGAEMIHADHGGVRAVKLSLVKDRFKNSYAANGKDPNGAKAKAWGRALENIDAGIHRDDWDGEEWLFVRADVVHVDADAD
jgi:hypothetical protein